MKKQLLISAATLLSVMALAACGGTKESSQPGSEPGSQPSSQPSPTPTDNLVVNGDLEVFRETIRTDAEIAVCELGTSWATEYGLGTYTGNGETVAKVTKVDGDPCMKLDGRGGSSNCWIWAGGGDADTYMYHPLGASPAGEYLIDVDLKYDVTGVTDPTMDALATEFLGGAAQSMIQFTEYAEFEALPASTVRGEGWKHAQFKLSKLAEKDGNGWFNLYVVPGERGGVLYMDNVQVRYNDEDPAYDFSYLIDVNDGDKGQFSSYYKRMLTNNYEENNGYYTIGTEDSKAKAVIDGDVVAMKLSYEGHGTNASFAKNVNLSSAVSKTVTLEFDAKFENLGENDVTFSFANDTTTTEATTVRASEGTTSTVAGFQHFSYDVTLPASALNRIQFSANTAKDISHVFEVTNLSVKVK